MPDGRGAGLATVFTATGSRTERPTPHPANADMLNAPSDHNKYPRVGEKQTSDSNPPIVARARGERRVRPAPRKLPVDHGKALIPARRLPLAKLSPQQVQVFLNEQPRGGQPRKRKTKRAAEGDRLHTHHDGTGAAGRFDNHTPNRSAIHANDARPKQPSAGTGGAQRRHAGDRTSASAPKSIPIRPKRPATVAASGRSA